MACVGPLFGCKHFRSAKGYISTLLMILGVVVGLRILLYLIFLCFKKRRPAAAAASESMDDGVEMQVPNVNQEHRIAIRRAMPGEPKFVILAGDDHVSVIAQPCPFQPNTRR
ncbi:hypothetical protein ACLOJK_040205 [Asimina triloba]